MFKHERPRVLVVGGHDPSSGAGIVADARAVERAGAYPQSAVTGLTIQTDTEFSKVHWCEEIALEQVGKLLRRTDFAALKIGLAPSLEFLKNLLSLVEKKIPLIVWDPIFSASAGFEFHQTFEEKVVEDLLKKIDLLTPNAEEAVKIWGENYEEHLRAENTKTAVLVKGGHGRNREVLEKLWFQGREHQWVYPRKEGVRRGTGCVLASLITAYLAQNISLVESVIRGREELMKYWDSTKTTMGVWEI